MSTATATATAADDRAERIAAHLGLVCTIAARFKRRWVEWEDLLAIGNMGLVKAANIFDPGRGLQFSTLAHHCIINEIRNHFRARRAAMRAGREFAQPHVGDDDDGEGLGLAESVPDHREPAPGKRAEQAEEVARVRALLRRLHPREARVIGLRFGLDGGAALTLEEVGNVLGVTRERVRQIEGVALRRMAEEPVSDRV